MKQDSIAILGGGNMGRALVGGLIARGAPPATIAVGEPLAERRAELTRAFGIRAHAGNDAAIAGATLVILAVKPQEMRATLTPLAAALGGAGSVLLSIAAGARIASLRRLVGADVPIVRAMPNRPALLGAGATALYASAEVAATARDTAERAMRSVGEVVWVDSEDALDVVTALSGSGPAYFFLLAELMCEAARELGLEPAAARRLAAQTLYGAGRLASEHDVDLARLRAEVTSKGGTTEAALAVYESAGLRAIVARALGAATQRSRELSDLTS